MKRLFLIIAIILIAVPGYALEKNVAGQRWGFFCFDETDNTPETAIASSAFTPTVYLDAVAVAGYYTQITELAGGYYDYTLTQASTNGDQALLYIQCGTANIQCIGVPPGIYTSPANWNDYSISAAGSGEIASQEKASIATILAESASSAAWGYINSGIVFRGVATAGDTTHATIGGLAGQGAGAFVDATTPWYGYVFRDAGGGGAAPQGETRMVSAYNNATGEFTFSTAFSAAIAAGDDIIIMSGRIAAIPEILADTDELQTNQGNWVTATGFSTHSAADVVNEWETQSQADPTGFHTNVMEFNGIAVSGHDPYTYSAAIYADTNELQTNQGDWATATGFSTHSAANVVDEFETQSQADPTGFHVNVLEVNGTAQTANDNGADINAILTDTSAYDTDAEIASAVWTGYNLTELANAPPATPTAGEALMNLHMMGRNKTETTSSESRVTNDAGTAIYEHDLTDDGTTFTKSEARAP